MVVSKSSPTSTTITTTSTTDLETISFSKSSTSSTNLKKLTKISSLQERKASLTKGERSKGKYYYQSRLFKLFIFIKSVQFLLGVLATLLKGIIPVFHPLTEQLYKDVQRGPWFDYLILPMVSWDSIYFINIARNGYRFEQEHAFFPLLPLIMNRGSALIGRFFPNTDPLILISITGALVSFTSLFVLSSNVYSLTILLGSSYKFAFISSCFVLISPALPFLHSIYTESLFGALATSGMVYLVRSTMVKDKYTPFTTGIQSWKKKLLAVLMFSLSCATRSNGVLLSGFFFYQALLCFISTNPSLNGSSIFKQIGIRLIYSTSYITYGLLTLVPFFVFQTWGYWHYCVDEGPTRPWCNAILPNIYSYVQRKYWNVGFMRYWTLQQIPNFILAFPMTILSIWAIWMFASLNHHPLSSTPFFSAAKGKLALFIKFIESPTTPHLILLMVMLAYTLLNAHVQIITRLFTFQPIIYWSMALLYFRSSRLRHAVVWYSLLTGVLGTFLFQHHSPPA